MPTPGSAMNSIHAASISTGADRASQNRKRPRPERVRSIRPPSRGSKPMSISLTKVKASPTAESGRPSRPA